MDAPAHLDTFLSYVGTNPNVRPRVHIVTRGQITDTLPTFAYTMPRGDLFAFPEFLAFLTLNTTRPGAGLFFKEYIDLNIATFRRVATLHKWAAHPASILMDVAEVLTRDSKNEEKLAAALSSPNSFFVPFNRITGVTVGRHAAQGWQTYIKLATLDGSAILHEDAAAESWFKSMGSMFGGKWEPELVAMLQDAARTNVRAR